jgi:hypothetical protein
MVPISLFFFLNLGWSVGLEMGTQEMGNRREDICKFFFFFFIYLRILDYFVGFGMDFFEILFSVDLVILDVGFLWVLHVVFYSQNFN